MKQILILGAGQSAPYMISYLLDKAEKHDWFITVGDRDADLAKKAIKRHPRGSSLSFDINDSEMRWKQVENADVVVNFLPPSFQYLLALSCIEKGTHMITASYQDANMSHLSREAHSKGILILNEMGLDPGIDHMSAMSLIKSVRDRGGRISIFKSYGSGLSAPDSVSNPLGYVITWNPKNVVMAGENGAQYLYKGKIKVVPHHEVFQRTWPVELEGIGKVEAYPNRDSLQYKDLFGLDYVHTMIRGTLRYPGWSETWLQIVRLGLANDTIQLTNLRDINYREFVEMFLPLHTSSANLEHRVANFLNISPTGSIMQKMEWLGLFSDEPVQCKHVNTAAEVLVDLLKRKLELPEKGKDMVAIVHELEAFFPKEKNRREKTTSTFIKYGEPGGYTAISQTVGLPAAIATELLLTDKLPITGCHIPTHPTVYPLVLDALKNMGYEFTEKTEEVVEEE
jgi:saccharopine dehydrogenase-like NADP-dependent oxidoreductase